MFCASSNTTTQQEPLQRFLQKIIKMQLPVLICTVALLLTGGVFTEDLVNEAVTTAPVAVNQTVVPAVPRTEDLVNESAVPVAGRVEPDNTTTTVPSTVPTTATTTVVPTADTTTVPVTTIGPVPTTPIPPPPRPPAPSKGTWIVRDPITNVTCVMATMAATVVVPYKTVNGEMWNATLNVPTDARADGSCAFPDQRITLSWNGNASAPLATSNNTVELIFSRNVTNATTEEGTQFYLSDVVVNAYPDPYNFPGTADLSVIQARASRSDLFTTPLNNSYSCRAEQHVPLSTGAVFNNTASLVLRNVQLEAYRTTDDQSFNKAVTCDADGMVTSDIVPIAVGCALAALVVVVLIAYLIGRRRARQRGYQSV